MEIIIIILLLILLAIDCYILYKSIPKKEKPIATPKLTKEENDKQKQLKQSFENLMNYDEKAARSSRK